MVFFHTDRTNAKTVINYDLAKTIQGYVLRIKRFKELENPVGY